MRLKSIQYSHYQKEPDDWCLEGCTLGDINLIVGKNAMGKTRTLNLISNLADLVSGDRRGSFYTEKWDAVFDNAGIEIRYLLECRHHKVLSEQLSQDGKTLLQRGADGMGKIYAENLKQDLDFQPPSDRLAVVSRMDALQHPFLDPLYHWGKGVRHFQFGSTMGHNNIDDDFAREIERFPNLKDSHLPVTIFRTGADTYKSVYVQQVIADMEKIGYELEDISIQPLSWVETPDGFVPEYRAETSGIAVSEKGLAAKTSHYGMSQGMFRTLSLIIQLNYSLLANVPSCVIIDDIGEGLDFNRSRALIDLLIEKIKGTQVQLIMTTNNRFVMNRVPLEYWSVIRRLPNKAKIYNYRNSKEVFDDFEFTGLSNFDFFSSNYLESKLFQKSMRR